MWPDNVSPTTVENSRRWLMYLVADERIEHVLSWHQIQTDEELAAALVQVKAAGLIAEEAVPLCVIGDGAPWIWKQAQALFPAAVEILDDDHGWEHLHKVAVLQYGAHPARQHTWYEATVARLCWGEVHAVIWGLQRMNTTNAQAAEEIDRPIRDLPRHQERLGYPYAR